MPDNPGRPAPGPWEGGTKSGEAGWGSPVPAGYGSLRSAGPAVAEPAAAVVDEAAPSPGAGGAAAAPRDPRRRHQAAKPTIGDRLKAASAARAKARSTANGAASPATAAANDAWHWTARAAEPVATTASTTAPSLPNGAVASPARRVPAERRPPARPRRPAEVWARGTVRRVDVLSVAKVSLIFYLMVLIIVVVASVMLWVVADAFGSIHSIERSVKTLFDLKKFTLHPTTVATYTSAGGAVLAVAGTLANVLAALMYNLISDLVGGVRIDVSSPDPAPEGEKTGRVGSHVR